MKKPQSNAERQRAYRQRQRNASGPLRGSAPQSPVTEGPCPRHYYLDGKVIAVVVFDPLCLPGTCRLCDQDRPAN
jgi:hypothetical protein